MSAPRAALAAIMAACVLPCCWAIGVASPGASVASHHLGFFEQQASAPQCPRSLKRGFRVRVRVHPHARVAAAHTHALTVQCEQACNYQSHVLRRKERGFLVAKKEVRPFSACLVRSPGDDLSEPNVFCGVHADRVCPCPRPCRLLRPSPRCWRRSATVSRAP